MCLCAGGFAQKHGVGFNKRWKTEYVSERMITTTIKCDQRKVVLTSVYCYHSGYADMHIEKIYRNIETNRNNKQTPRSSRATSTLSLDLE